MIDFGEALDHVARIEQHSEHEYRGHCLHGGIMASPSAQGQVMMHHRRLEPRR
ncbi:hypothetical protein ACVWZR_001863 [Bradyrhizobium sp. i1.3.1]